MEQIKEGILSLSVVVLALASIVSLVRAVLGPRFTDRIIAINLINTMVTAIFALLSVLMEEDFLINIALVYSLLSFLTVVVAAQLVILKRRRELEKRTTTIGGQHD